MGVGPYGASIAALALGILWIYRVATILSLIFGYISLGQIKGDSRHKGKGKAIAFIVYAARSGVDGSNDHYSY